ncbi:MAG TPA: outer membrane beta-barrel protein [Gemmatimonadales bacterium]|nr:outer membrane beta-barrel protein [Gemmatimonadales bacterium]
MRMSRVGRAASALVVVYALGVASATAQGIQAQFGVGLGRAIPTGAFRGDSRGEGFSGAWTGTAHVTLQAPRWPVGLRIEAVYAAHTANDQLKSDLTTSFGQPADETIKLPGASAAVAYALKRGQRVTPSVFGGIGVYHVTIAVTTGGTTTHNSATRLGWQVGGELTYRAVFLELRYVAVAAVPGFHKTAFFPITAGVRFGHPSAT